MNSGEENILKKLDKARNLYMERNFTAASELYREILPELQEDPENLPVIQVELGWSFYQQAKYREAIEMLEEALKSGHLLPRQRFDCHRIIGFCHEMLNEFSEARVHLEDALSIQIPDDVKRYTYFELGKMLFTRRQILEAGHFLKIADKFFSEAEPDYKTALAYYLGFIEFFQQNFDEARRYFDYVITAGSDNKTRAGGFFGLAHLHYQKKDYQALIDICEKILRLDNAFFDKETLGYFMSYAYLHLKRWDNLERFFSELEKNYPDGRYVQDYPMFREALQNKSTGNRSSDAAEK